MDLQMTSGSVGTLRDFLGFGFSPSVFILPPPNRPPLLGFGDDGLAFSSSSSDA